jgi:diguanylate cyclase (GGDEF)-like protein
MHHRIIRFASTERGRLTLVAVSITLALLGGLGLCKAVLDEMLRKDAEATSSGWASMLGARNPEILTMLSGAPPSDRTRQVLEDASQFGDIYRFRIWDKAGHLIFKSERIPSADTPTAAAQKRVADCVRSGAIINRASSDNAPHNVPFFVESYIPVKQNGAVIGVFDVYLDQSDDKGLYQRSIFVTEIIIAILVLSAGGLPGYIVYRQMVDQRAAKAEAQYLSEHDGLTGISNRKRLRVMAKSVMALSKRNGSSVAALMIDLDRFKDINESFGHGTGDELLKSVAMRLMASVREEDLVARHGGDEFVVVQVGVEQPNGASLLAERLIRILSEPHEIAGMQVVCGASIGVAAAPPDAEDFDKLLACADAALSKSKADGCNTASFFEPGMDSIIRERRQLEEDLRRALATEAFTLAYQPFYSFQDGALLGFEALLRWPEDWTPRSPAVFIPVAEESGLITRIGAWVLETACRTASTWSSPLKVAVNLSPAQFRHGDIVSDVEEALRISGLDAARLELEVTESLWIKDSDIALDQLRRLRRIGVTIALDDFGTGYSSLSYLWKFPFDTVKIDRSFVMGMESEPKAAAIVNTITALGKALDLTITAEGVETAAQAQFLKQAGCDRAQGFLFGRPLSQSLADALANGDGVPAKEGSTGARL